MIMKYTTEYLNMILWCRFVNLLQNKNFFRKKYVIYALNLTNDSEMTQKLYKDEKEKKQHQ